MFCCIAREFIRDPPCFTQASRSQDLAAEGDAKMADYEMPIEEQVKALLKEVRAGFDAVDHRLDKLEVLRESMDEHFKAITKTNAEQTGLLKSVIAHVRGRVERIEQRRRS
jgi:hypothetical protein